MCLQSVHDGAQILLLPCSHVICPECVGTWIEMARTADAVQCPVCRQRFEDLRRMLSNAWHEIPMGPRGGGESARCYTQYIGGGGLRDNRLEGKFMYNCVPELLGQRVHNMSSDAVRSVPAACAPPTVTVQMVSCTVSVNVLHSRLQWHGLSPPFPLPMQSYLLLPCTPAVMTAALQWWTHLVASPRFLILFRTPMGGTAEFVTGLDALEASVMYMVRQPHCLTPALAAAPSRTQREMELVCTTAAEWEHDFEN